MKILKVIKKPDVVEFQVEVDSKIWKDQQAKSFKEIASKITIPGFRKGHVPEKILKNRITTNDLLSKSIQPVLQKLYSKVLEDKQFDKEQYIEEVLETKILKMDSDNLQVSFIFEIYPKVTLPNYKKISLPSLSDDVSQHEIDQQINQLIQNDTMLLPLEDAVAKKGMMANIDFEGFIDNKPFPGGKANGYDLEIGSNSFIPGFEDQIIGMKMNESKRIKVTFPKNYHAKEFAGKDAEFQVTLNQLKEIKKPEINQAYLQKFGFQDVKNLEELKAYFQKQIQAYKKYQNDDQYKREIAQYIIKNAKLSTIPQSLLKVEYDRIDNETKKRAQEADTDYVKYVTKTLNFKSLEEYQAKINESAKANLILAITLQEIIKDLKLKATEKDIQNKIEQLANSYHLKPSDLAKTIETKRDLLESMILQEKVFDEIIKINKTQK